MYVYIHFTLCWILLGIERCKLCIQFISGIVYKNVSLSLFLSFLLSKITSNGTNHCNKLLTVFIKDGALANVLVFFYEKKKLEAT